MILGCEQRSLSNTEDSCEYNLLAEQKQTADK